MKIKLSEVRGNDLLNTLIISAWNVCKMLYVMEAVSLDVGTWTVKRTWLLHGKDLVRQCPPLGLNFKPSLMVIVLNSRWEWLFLQRLRSRRRVTVIAVFDTTPVRPTTWIKGQAGSEIPLDSLYLLRRFCGLRPIRKLMCVQSRGNSYNQRFLIRSLLFKFYFYTLSLQLRSKI